MKHTLNTFVRVLERTKPESAPPAPPSVVDTRICLTVSVGETNTDSPDERTAMVPPKSSCATGVDTLSVAPAFCGSETVEDPKAQAGRPSVQPHSRQLIQPWTKGRVSVAHPARRPTTVAGSPQQHQSEQSKLGPKRRGSRYCRTYKPKPARPQQETVRQENHREKTTSRLALSILSSAHCVHHH